MEEDSDGSSTIKLLTSLSRVTSLIAGNDNRSRSLGLHPAVYFYSATGNYQPAALLATISFIKNLERADKLDVFTRHRHDFEEMLLECKSFINLIVKHYGSGFRALDALIAMYTHLFDGIRSGTVDTAIYSKLVADEKPAFIEQVLDPNKGTPEDFTSERKSAIYLNKALETAIRCGVCNARVHTKSLTIDHIVPKRDGGRATE